jgi:1-acyl-sn-glycerol-3-phosphate acyltransferase
MPARKVANSSLADHRLGARSILAGQPSCKRRHHVSAFFARISKGFGNSISQLNAPCPLGPTLFIMNHISWADIAVMISMFDADFVAKADMQGWPVIGWHARRFNPVCVARG